MSLIIDCDSCVMRDLACHDCAVTVLLGPLPDAELDNDSVEAIEALAHSGLVPPLRMVTSLPSPDVRSARA